MKIIAIFALLCLGNLSTSHILEKSREVVAGVNEDGGKTSNIHFQLLKDWFGLSVNVLETTNTAGETFGNVDICKKFGFFNHYDDIITCLQLRIKTKDKHTKSPVAVIIKDTDDIDEINNNPLNKDNVVLVTIHKKHFTDTSSTELKNDIPDVIDIKDIIKSLKWIRENIYKFGGDEDHVILVGNQNTSDKINKLKNTKYEGKWFHDVLIQAGPTTNNGYNIDTETNDRVVRDIAKEVGCVNINTESDLHKCLVNIPKWRLNDAHRRIIQKYGGDINDIGTSNPNDRVFDRNYYIRQSPAGYNNFKQYDNENQYYQRFGSDYGLNDRYNRFDDLNTKDMRTTRDYRFGNNDLTYNYGRQGGWQRNMYQDNVPDFDNTYQKFYDFRCRQFGDC